MLRSSIEQLYSNKSTAASTPGCLTPGYPVSEAISLGAQYLENACDQSGKFAYLVDVKTNSAAPKYNVLRHAGAMYGLAVSNGFKPDRSAVDALARAGSFLRQTYIAPQLAATGGNPAKAILAAPAEMKDRLSGATGLSLIGLCGLRQAQPEAVQIGELKTLGQVLVALQQPDGGFLSRSESDEEGKNDSGGSLYYPGEAALGLLSLYEQDRSKEWLDAAEKALLYLAKSREGAAQVPADCWALIATAKLVEIQDREGLPVQREILVRHAAQICEEILREQVSHARLANVNGGFDSMGRTTPTATRLEGLLSALEFLPKEKSDLRSRIENALPPAIAFLLQAQVRSGPYAGGFRGAVNEIEIDPATEQRWIDSRASEIRIDYVQHAVCALIHYERLFHPEARN